jgi:hypothetical protein
MLISVYRKTPLRSGRSRCRDYLPCAACVAKPADSQMPTGLLSGSTRQWMVRDALRARADEADRIFVAL